MIFIEFFSGSKIMTETFKENGFYTFSIDIEKKYNPNLCIDVMDFNVSMLPSEFKQPDVIWMSPPCTSFSIASGSRHFKNGKPISDDAKKSIILVMKCLNILKELRPKYWFIENPRGMLRKMDFMQNLPRKTVTYCKYGTKYQKPTDIWTNNNNFIPKYCLRKAGCHEYQPSGSEAKKALNVSKKGLQGLSNAFERSKIPKELCEEIVKSCLNKTIEVQLELK